jgi:hypothetical protein
MELNKADHQWWDGRIWMLEKYDGICDKCGTPVTYFDGFQCLKLKETDRVVIFAPLIRLTCPFCNVSIDIVRQYKSLDVTLEFLQLEKQ